MPDDTKPMNDQRSPKEGQIVEAEEARQATRGNGVWIILSVSTGLAIAALLVLYGGALS